MATAINPPRQNDSIGKPGGTTENQVYSLPVTRILAAIPGRTPQHKPETAIAFVHCWQFSKEELEELIKNDGKAYVKMWGVTLAPMSVHSSFPVEEPIDHVLTEYEITALHEGRLYMKDGALAIAAESPKKVSEQY